MNPTGHSLMSDAIAMHGSGGLSKRAKRENSTILDHQFAAAMADIERRYPGPVVSAAEKLLSEAHFLRTNILPLANRRQQKKILAQAEALEAKATPEAALYRLHGKLYDTDQVTGETFDALLRAAVKKAN